MAKGDVKMKIFQLLHQAFFRRLFVDQKRYFPMEDIKMLYAIKHEVEREEKREWNRMMGVYI